MTSRVGGEGLLRQNDFVLNQTSGQFLIRDRFAGWLLDKDRSFDRCTRAEALARQVELHSKPGCFESFDGYRPAIDGGRVFGWLHRDNVATFRQVSGDGPGACRDSEQIDGCLTGVAEFSFRVGDFEAGIFRRTRSQREFTKDYPANKDCLSRPIDATIGVDEGMGV